MDILFNLFIKWSNELHRLFIIDIHSFYLSIFFFQKMRQPFSVTSSSGNDHIIGMVWQRNEKATTTSKHLQRKKKKVTNEAAVWGRHKSRWEYYINTSYQLGLISLRQFHKKKYDENEDCPFCVTDYNRIGGVIRRSWPIGISSVNYQYGSSYVVKWQW